MEAVTHARSQMAFVAGPIDNLSRRVKMCWDILVAMVGAWYQFSRSMSMHLSCKFTLIVVPSYRSTIVLPDVHDGCRDGVRVSDPYGPWIRCKIFIAKKMRK